MKKIILILALFLIAFSESYATKKYTFLYDAAGNRYSRTYSTFRVPVEDDSINTMILEQHQVNVYPNPAKDYIQVDISSIASENIISVQLLDLKGTELFKKENVTGPFQVEMSDFAAGMYFLNIQIDDRRIVWKVVKE